MYEVDRGSKLTEPEYLEKSVFWVKYFEKGLFELLEKIKMVLSENGLK